MVKSRDQYRGKKDEEEEYFREKRSTYKERRETQSTKQQDRDKGDRDKGDTSLSTEVGNGKGKDSANDDGLAPEAKQEMKNKEGDSDETKHLLTNEQPNKKDEKNFGDTRRDKDTNSGDTQSARGKDKKSDTGRKYASDDRRESDRKSSQKFSSGSKYERDADREHRNFTDKRAKDDSREERRYDSRNDRRYKDDTRNERRYKDEVRDDVSARPRQGGRPERVAGEQSEGDRVRRGAAQIPQTLQSMTWLNDALLKLQTGQRETVID